MKTILFYEQSYEDVSNYFVRVPDKKVKVAKKIIEVCDYYILGLGDIKNVYGERKSVSEMTRRLSTDILVFDKEMEIIKWKEDEKQKDDLKAVHNPSMSISGHFPQTPSDMELNEYLISRKNSIYWNNKENRRNKKLIEQWRKG